MTGLVPVSGTRGRKSRQRRNPENKKTPPKQGFLIKRLKGLEPSTFCMASRRSSQLSYSRATGRV